GVSPATAFIVASLPPVSGPASDAPRALPGRTTEPVSWHLASGKVNVGRAHCDHLGLSADGAIVLCALYWGELQAGGATARRLAPEWAPPVPEDQWPRCRTCKPQAGESGISVLSAWLSADGKSVYVTYERTVGGQEWRLDRWIPDATSKTGGRLEH